MMPGISERAFQAQFIEAAGYLGWHHYHTFDSRRSNPGFPDLVLWRPGRLAMCELKAERGRISPEQHRIHEELAAALVDIHTWRPSQWDELMEWLR